MLFYFLTLKIGQNVYFSYNSAIQSVKILNHMSSFAWYLLARAPQGAFHVKPRGGLQVMPIMHCAEPDIL